MRPGVIIFQLEIFVVEAENIFHVRIDFHGRQGTRGTGELQVYLFQVVQLNMGITEGMNKVARFQAGYLCHHLQQ